VTDRQATTDEAKVGLRSMLRDPLVGPLIGVVLVVLTGIGLVFPIMPLFARSYGVGNDGAGALIGAFGLARLVGDLIGGTIVDRRGERWAAVAGMSVVAVASSATAASPTFPAALLFWSVAGAGSAVTFAALFSYVLKAAHKERMARTLSFFYGAFNIGVIGGGAAGGVLADLFGLSAPLYAYSVVLIAGIAVYLRFVPVLPGVVPDRSEVPAVPKAAGFEAPGPSEPPLRDFFRLPGFATTLFLNLAYLWMVATVFNTLVPLFATDRLGMSPSAIGLMFAIGVAAEFLVLFPAGTLADRHGRKAVMVPSLVALSIMVVVLGFSGSALMLTILLTILAITSGFAGVPPAAMLSDIVPEEQKGRAVGAFRFAGDIGFFLGPLLAGVVSKIFGFEAAFGVTALIPAIGVVLMLRTRETMRPKPPAPVV
jgi:MFS family permease